MKRYTHDEMHWLLIEGPAKPAVRLDAADVEDQAFLCPYYVKLSGVLGDDYGVIVCPESYNFGHLVFEHDDCGCPEGLHETGRQVTDEWRDRKREREEARAEKERRSSHQGEA